MSPSGAGALPSPSPSGTAGLPSPTPSGAGAIPSPSPIPSAGEEAADAREGIDGRLHVALPPGIELYSRDVSIVPGGPLRLAVSTTARTYRVTIERVDATARGGVRIVARTHARVGRDQRSRATITSASHTARANWQVTDTIGSTGWKPGVYVAAAQDSAGSRGNAIFVVRTPALRADRPAFVFTSLTYAAYNLWGGSNLYSYAGVRATRVSFDRPYDLDVGLGTWRRGDDRTLRWLQQRGLPLQYTTDYDLAVDPPTVAPRLLILPRHAEYVTGSLRDWVEQHVNEVGDMNVLSYGANGFYWQARLVRSEALDGPLDIVCWKGRRDPMLSVDSALTTVRWREHPLDRPEGAVFGAQYTGVVGNGYRRSSFVVTDAMPRELLAGTGWRPGTVLHGLLKGETDAVYPSSGGVAIMRGLAVDDMGAPLASSVTIRTSPAGARVFDAGTFAWADGFSPPGVSMGVSAASFDRFNRNILAWLGLRGRPSRQAATALRAGTPR